MWIADTLSRAYRNTTESAQHNVSEVRALEEIDHSDGLSIAPRRLEQLKKSTVADPVMQDLIMTIETGWAINRKKCPPALTPFYNNRSELVEDNRLVYLGERLAVPVALRKEIFTKFTSPTLELRAVLDEQEKSYIGHG